MKFENIFNIDPYSLDRGAKHKLLNGRLHELTTFHYNHCEEYRRMLKAAHFDIDNLPDYEKLPALPVRLFKDMDLKSVSKDDIVKTMTSSGTTGQQVSKIYIDRETAANQTKALVKIVSSFIGTKRVPMIILDTNSVIRDRNMFSARGAGILGFSMFASKKIYAMDENMKLDVDILNQFIDNHKGKTIFMFGFTFMIWLHFYKQLVKTGYHPDLSKAILIHGGGWKKLANEQVSSGEFKQRLHEVCGIEIKNIHDYYGMVEQTGTICMECECGHLHTSVLSDVIVRNPLDFKIARNGEKGVIEVVSLLPQSYPGHILLTEDEGVILGEDDCPCGRKGKYFKIEGRIKNAEIRGCSDTYASKSGNLAGFRYVVGDEPVVAKMPKVKAFSPFSEELLSFLNDLSRLVMQKGREYSDVMTFGFWCRRSSLLREKIRYDDLHFRLGRGIVFHSTPSNVPVNFAFSFAAGLLAGNANIVRLPAKDFKQVDIICNAVYELLCTSHKEMAPYICFVKYPPSIEITNKFSSICQSRVIWGGDATIAEIRQSPLKSRATEITFADRFSIAVIDADRYLINDNKQKLAQEFYNDTYFSDQNACTAPRIIIWMGKAKNTAKKEFWNNLLMLVKKNYSITAVQSIGKLTALYKAAAELEIADVKMESLFIHRIAISSLDDEIMNYKYNSGFFFEYDAKGLDDIIPLCSEKCQTLTYYGLSKEQIDSLVLQGRPQGIDRIVPMGKSMDFTLIWDGYDLIRCLSRIVSVI